VALVVGPTGAGEWPGRLAALTSCVLASLAYMLVRYLRRTEPTFTIAVSFPAVTFALFAPPFLVGAPGFEWVWPTAADWFFLTAMAVTAAVGQVLLTLGLGRVPAARGTALSNLQVAFALLYGIVFFDEFPTWVTISGAVILVCAQILLATSRPAGHDRRVGA
jgi:drug/metabolite transporter (DMT)-like permease